MAKAQVTFDLPEGEQKKEAGLSLASEMRGALLKKAQDIAFSIALHEGEVTYDEVFEGLLKEGLDPIQMGNAAGTVFRDRTVFQFTGRWKKSSRVSNHSRVNRVWELAD